MPRFAVDRAFYMPKRDAIVLTGRHADGTARAGMLVDFPKILMGPGFVPILSVEEVQWADGSLVPCLVIADHEVERSPFFDPGTLDGRVLDVRERDGVL